MIELWHRHGGSWEDFINTDFTILQKLVELENIKAHARERKKTL